MDDHPQRGQGMRRTSRELKSTPEASVRVAGAFDLVPVGDNLAGLRTQLWRGSSGLGMSTESSRRWGRVMGCKHALDGRRQMIGAASRQGGARAAARPSFLSTELRDFSASFNVCTLESLRILYFMNGGRLGYSYGAWGSLPAVSGKEQRWPRARRWCLPPVLSLQAPS